MKRLAVLNVVGLSKSCLGEYSPKINAFSKAQGRSVHSFKPEFPAVTCTAQSTYLTGSSVAEHGVVGNGWYDRESAEHRFWKQSNHLVHGEKVWDRLRKLNPDFTCAKLFWWYNMYSGADYTITPRPMYPADGRKVFDVSSEPLSIRDEIKKDLGDFPFQTFWGPAAGIASSQWIAESAKWIEKKYEPSLNLVYLPHLDYALQKCGPNSTEAKQAITDIDELVGDLIDFFTKRGVEVMILSEYGISEVSKPVHLNRIFREKGWLTVKKELGREMLDLGASKVFAIADHQVAHIYVNDLVLLEEVRSLLTSVDGVDKVYSSEGLWGESLAAERGGDLVAMSDPNAWFTYYYWGDDNLAPDFARTIDIHRKQGYDPCELFLDPTIRAPKLKVAKFLLKKKLGLRGLLDVIPLDAKLVKGSHGRDDVDESEMPLIIGNIQHENITKTKISSLIEEYIMSE